MKLNMTQICHCVSPNTVAKFIMHGVLENVDLDLMPMQIMTSARS